MNLVGDPWIPVVFSDGRTDLVSLKELYEQGGYIRDLVATPPQRIALMRLLICITQAALDGPEDEKGWFNCKNMIAPESLRYLENRKERFHLFGEHPFLQIPYLECTKSNDEFSMPMAKLDEGLAVGSTGHTLFDREALHPRTHSCSWLAFMLVTCQNFALGGGQSLRLKWTGLNIDGSVNGRKNNNFTNGPCAGSILFTFLQSSENILNTLWLNIVSKEQLRNFMPGLEFGRPVWDESVQDYENTVRLTKSYLGRLVPLSRFLLLNQNNHSQIRFFTNGLSYPSDLKIYRELMATIVLTEIKNGVKDNVYLRVDTTKHPWRELSSILSISKRESAGGAAALAHLRTLAANSSYDLPLVVWVGGVQNTPGKAKVINTAEWTFFLNLYELERLEFERYQEGVSIANYRAGLLKNAVGAYFADLNVSDFEKNEKGKYIKFSPAARENRDKIVSKALSFYWSKLDNSYGVLLSNALEQDGKLKRDWLQILAKAMRKAYDYACPHETPRQIQAFIHGLKDLRLKRPET